MADGSTFIAALSSITYRLATPLLLLPPLPLLLPLLLPPTA